MADPLILQWAPVPEPLTLQWTVPDQPLAPIRPDAPLPSVVTVIGPPGRPGADGGTTLDATAARALSGHRVLILKPLADYPDLTAPGGGELIAGISTGAAAPGAPVEIQRAGEMIEATWSWTPGPVFAGALGVLTQTPPIGAWLRQVAVAVAPTRILIDLRPSINLT